MTELDFEKLYKTSLTAMRLNKIHPDIPRTKSWYIISAVNQIVCTAVFLGVIYNIILSAQNGDITQVCQFSVLWVVYVMITVQKITIFANKNMLNMFIKQIKEDFKADWFDDEKTIILKYALAGKKVCVIWFILSVYAGALFILKHIALEIYTYYQEGKFVLLEFYPAVYPSFIEKHKFHPLVYAVMYVVLVSRTTNSCMIYIAMAPFCPICILHACGQLAIAKKRIEKLNVDKVQEFEENIKTIIQLLQKVYKFVDDINAVFGLIHEVIMKINMFIIPLTWLVVRMGYERGELAVEFISFSIGSVYMSSSLCYYGQQLMQSGNDIASAIYSCGWEKTFDRNVRISVLVILHRAQQTVAIRSLFCEFGMESLTDLYRQSFACLNLMNAMWK